MLGYETGVAKLQGYSFIVDSIRDLVLRKDDARVKVISLQAGSFIVYQLPETLSVEAVRFEPGAGAFVMTDGDDPSINLTDAPHGGKL